MDFDTILEKWESRKDRTKAPSTHPGEPDNDDHHWLDRYPPGQQAVEDKDSEPKPPVSEGRSIWLRRAPQDSVDLHGLVGREAREELARFIRSMRRRGLRKGLVIHGKGLHSSDGAVLGPVVREYLEMSTEVGEFGRAARKDGGSGATWFILRQRSR